MTEEDRSGKNDKQLNTSSNDTEVSGCAIMTFAIFVFFAGVGVIIYSVNYTSSILLFLVGLFITIFVAGFFFLYPIIRFFLGSVGRKIGREGVALTTVIVEAIITEKVTKHINKKNKKK